MEARKAEERALKKANKLDKDVWYLDGVAYDFTKFVDQHPGGWHALQLGKGREIEGLFQSYHVKKLPSDDILAKYRLPKDDPRQRPKYAPAQKFSYEDSGFFRTCCKDAEEYFRENKLSSRASYGMLAFNLFNVIAMFAASWYMSVNASYAVSALHGVLRAMLVVQTVHAASHFSLFQSQVLNRWMYRVGTILIGLWAPPVWDIQHLVAHHIYTNEWPYDTDSGFPLKSIHATQKRLPFHKYQHLYIWLVYALTIPLVMINSIRVMLTQKQVTYNVRFDGPASRSEGLLCTVFGIAYILVPFFFQPFWTAYGLTVTGTVVSSLYFSLQFVVNHEIDEVEHDAHALTNEDWGAYQARTSCDFAPMSWLWLHLSGGLNTQIEHHLFPGIHYSHYKTLHEKVVKPNCKKFGLPLLTKDTLFDALSAHYRLLKNPPQSVRQTSSKAPRESGITKAAKEMAAAAKSVQFKQI